MTVHPPAELAAWDQRFLWHPFTQMRDWLAEEPVIIERGEGNYLIDTRGRRYLDGVSSLWCNVHGHRKAELDQALREQSEKIAHSTPFWRHQAMKSSKPGEVYKRSGVTACSECSNAGSLSLEQWVR